MLKRSLALKVYLYLVCAILILGALGKFTMDHLIRTNQQDLLRQMMETRVQFLTRELSSYQPLSQEAEKRLQDLEKGLEWELRYLPWASSDYPVELAQTAVLVAPGMGRTPLEQRFWARVERNGIPLGALEVQFQPPLLKHQRAPWAALVLFLLLLAVLTLPPLAWWVIRPIQRLERAIDRLGAGDLKTAIPTMGSDEVGRLAGAFEAMRTRIQSMLHEKERLLSDVSHELRSPLARMAIAQSLLEAESGESPYVGKLRHELQQMDHLVGELLDWSRQNEAPLHLQAVDLEHVIEELLYERELLLADYALKVSLAPAVLDGDRDKLKRALGNVLDNALKYTPQGGSLVLSLENHPDAVRFQLTDSGPGIPQADLPHLFEPFYRPDTARSRKTGGAGLGLAIVKAVIDRHGGTVRIDSQEERGTTVAIELPRKKTA